jgi:hypothetical protein
VTNDFDSSKLLILKIASRNLNIPLSDDEIKKLSLNKISSLNDAYYYITTHKINLINKKAYPNYVDQLPIEQPFDINKWMKIVHDIYESVNNKMATIDQAVEYYSNYLDKDREEDVNFKNWFNFFRKGEHLKYAKGEGHKMKKNAVYMSGISPIGESYLQSGGSPFTKKQNGFNMPGDSFDGSEVSKEKEVQIKKEDFDGWKKRIHSAIRSIDKLIRNEVYIDPETFEAVSDILKLLSNNVVRIKLASTASDLTLKAADSMVKCGYFDGADILEKVAQEVAQPEAAPQPPEQAPPAAAGQVEPGAQAEQPAAPEEPKKSPKDAIPRGDDVEPVDFEDIEQFPPRNPDEYDKLIGDATLSKASSKLDEVAGMLADRRVVRMLAEFDIVLDKLGIASMFPELAESQSKLIDAYSYALTRVTKMMGQLANAQTLMSSQSGVPGAVQAAISQEQKSEE